MGMERAVFYTHRGWVAVLAVLMVLTVVSGCGDPVRSTYSTREVFDRYDENGVEREGYVSPAEPIEASDVSEEDGPFDFGHCVAFALKNAPQIIEGAVQIQLEDLNIDEKYARMFPEFRVRMTVSSVIFSETADESDDDDDKTSMRLSFSSGAYDPFGAYISYEAQKVLKRVAVMQHLGVIDELIYSIALQYLAMENLEKRLSYLAEIEALLKRLVDYYSALPAGEAKYSIELLEAREALKSNQLAKEKERVKLKKMAIDLKLLIGADLEVDQGFAPVGATRSVLGGFDSGEVTLEMVKEADRELQISKMGKEVSKHNILLARSKYIPIFSLGLRTPDPVSSGEDVDKDYYLTMAMETKLWDWGIRSLGVERANINSSMSVFGLKKAVKRAEAKFINAKHTLELAEAVSNYENSVMELNELKYQKSQILYESGVISLPKLLMSQVALIKSRIAVGKVALERDIALLDFKKMSGKLFSNLVSEVTDATH